MQSLGPNYRHTIISNWLFINGGGGLIDLVSHLQLSASFRVYVAEQSKKQDVSRQHRASPHVFTLAHQGLTTTGKLASPLVLAELAFWAPLFVLAKLALCPGKLASLFASRVDCSQFPGPRHENSTPQIKIGIFVCIVKAYSGIVFQHTFQTPRGGGTHEPIGGLAFSPILRSGELMGKPTNLNKRSDGCQLGTQLRVSEGGPLFGPRNFE